MDVLCTADVCPVILNATCVFYEANTLIYTGITTNDSVQTALQKIDAKFGDAMVGYIFTNGVSQPFAGAPVGLGGSLTANTSIGGNFTLTFAGNVQAAKHITTGGTASQFVKGDGTLDSTAYQAAGNYITALTGDVIAAGPGSVNASLAVVNSNPGTYGSSTRIPIVTVDTKGRVTALTTTAVSVPSGILSFVGDVYGSGVTGSATTLTLTNVNTNVYTNNTFLKFKVNAKGLVTGATPVTNLDVEAVLGYVPTPETRKLSINGVQYDLQSDVYWTIATGVGSVTASAPLVSTGGATPNISIPKADATNDGYLDNVDWTTFNNKVPQARTLTINGITYDLSANRSWNVVSMIYPGAGIAVSTGTAWGTSIVDNSTNWNTAYTERISSTSAPLSIASNAISISQSSASTNGYLSSSDWTTFNNKEGSITPGTTAQYWRGDKSWQTLDTTAVVEGSNLYYTDGRVRLALSVSTPLTYDNTTGAFGIQVANTSQSGYLTSTDWNTFNNKQPAAHYITDLTGEATGAGPGIATVTLSTPAVTGKVLTGVNITGGTVVDTDTILQGIGKLQNQINGLIGGSIYEGVWNAATNTPTLVSSVGTDGHYYIVNVAGNTNLNGITNWNVGDWAIFHGGVWQKVDNTDAVISVNGYTGAVSLVSSDIPEGATNLYFTNTRARQAISLTTTGSSGAATYNDGTGVLNIPNYNPDLSGYVPTSRTLTINGTAFDLTADRSWSVGTVTSVAELTLGTTGTDVTSSVATGTTTPVITLNIPTASATNRGALSSTDWTTFNSKQAALSGTGFVKISGTTISYDNSTYLTTASAASTYLPLAGGTLTGAVTGTRLVLAQNSADITLSIVNAGTGRAFSVLGTSYFSADISFGSLSNGVLKANALGALVLATAGTDYQAPLSGTGFVKSTAGVISYDTSTYYLASNPSGFITSSGTAAAVSQTVTGTNSAELVRGNMADNDQFRILVGGTASNAGFVEIATADDGNEPIFVRQYTGVFSTLVRTATLLDASGNTTFPGTLQVNGYLRTAGATSNTILWAGGTQSADFGNVLGQGSSSRTTFFRGSSSCSVWWGGTDGLGNIIPFTALDATSGEFTFWRNSGGVGGGNWTQIMTMNASGLTMNSGNFIGSLTGAASGNVVSRGQSNWNDSTVIGNVVGMLSWKNYGNGHVIFDASAGTSPSGGAVNATNSAVAWTSSYPTLMGWNGSTTYGVRVDSARYADSAGSAGSVSNGVYTNATTNSLSGILNFGAMNATPYANATGTSNGISFGGYESSSLRQYGIFTELENVGGNYSKLTLNYHTGIRLGASSSYGGTRFYNDAINGTSTVIFSVGNGDNNVRVTNTLFIGGNTALHAGNYNSYSPTLTGGGASGTWAISISGNAASATNSINATYASNASGGFTNTGGHGSSFIQNELPAAQNGAATGRVVLRQWCSEPGVTWDWAGFGYNVTNDGGSPSGFGRINTNFGQAYMRFSTSGDLYFYNTNTSGTRVTTMSLSSGGTASFSGTVNAAAYRGNANVAGTGEATYHPAGIYSTGNNWLYGSLIMGGNSISGASSITSNGLIRISGNTNLYLDYNYGCSIVGVYASTRFQGVFSMGDAYKLAIDGTSPGNLYGLSWSHPNAGGQAGYLNDHGLLVMVNGLTYSALSSNIWARGRITATSDVYSEGGWFYSYNNAGWYNNSYGQGIRPAKANVTYGSIINLGENFNGYGGYAITNNYNTIFMQNSGGDHGFFRDGGGGGWSFFYHQGYNCAGIGTDATDPSYSLHIIKYGGSNTGWIIWSDRRIKENIKTIDNALDKVLSLRGVYYNKIDDPNKERCVGYIAQEVMEVVPELVVYSEELDMYNMNYAPMVGMLTEAVKEHHAKTVAQQAEIDTLKEQVQALLNHINNGI